MGDGGRGGGAFFALYAKPAGGPSVTRALEGPVDVAEYEGASGSVAANHGLPRFARCAFAAAYPLAQVKLSDPQVPVAVGLEAFNPLIPANADDSGIPIAVLRYTLTNRTNKRVAVSVCGSLPNFIGNDGVEELAQANRNRFRKATHCQGIFMDSEGVEPTAISYGTMALTTTAKTGITYRTAWKKAGWGTSLLDFWDDFTADGRVEERPGAGADMPNASLAVRTTILPKASKTITFLLTWHFPNRHTWSPGDDPYLGNYYATHYGDAWDVAGKTAPRLKKLEQQTVRFVSAFAASDLPEVVKEAALFNLSTLRTQTCFRTPDGRLFGWEGYNDHAGCCMGSCTHVWNYEQSTAFLFGELACTMRDTEFNHATDDQGMMNFRVHLPLSRAQEFGKAAADGQMGCIMKAYRDWQLCGDDGFLQSIWPKVKKALGILLDRRRVGMAMATALWRAVSTIPWMWNTTALIHKWGSGIWVLCALARKWRLIWAKPTLPKPAGGSTRVAAPTWTSTCSMANTTSIALSRPKKWPQHCGWVWARRNWLIQIINSVAVVW